MKKKQIISEELKKKKEEKRNKILLEEKERREKEKSLYHLYDIVIKNISKSFRTKKALKNVSFNIKKGEVHGLVGPNGSGKTTLMKIINRLIVPDDGEIFIEGKKIFRDNDSNNNVGFAPSEVTMLEDLTVEDFVYTCNYYLKGLDKDFVKNYIDTSILNGLRKQKIKELSTGLKKIVQILNVTLSKPKILILDEPTSGLDALNRKKLFLEIEKLRENKERTIIVSTHIFSDLENIADSLTIIKDGEIVFSGKKEGSIQDLYEKFFPLSYERKDEDEEVKEHEAKFEF